MRRLNDPEFSARQSELARNKRAERRVTAKASANANNGGINPFRPWKPNKAMQDRVRNHLVKGRDVGDIAVREGIMLSVAQRIVQHVRGGHQADPAQDSRRPRDAGRA
jgi:hypothetical protein